ncbi:MAG: phosphoribosylformylglycinamidine synthase subunit PurQ [Candidatus Aenigmarchaeota archaeon]|nr:phosphoribosylformylglycinamidine synthase subunit PurQ [Candidatus Aenigmarchaeota archaeon]
MKPVIAVPYFPGSNGDTDAIERIGESGMKAEHLYFHFGNEKRLSENARIMVQTDGAFLCGGFPYEDRLGFGRVPAKIKQYADALRAMVDAGKPVLAVCSGNQIANVMRLAFPVDSPYRASLLPNIYDRDGEIVYNGFIDRVVHTKLACNPERTAFTRNYEKGEIMPQVIDHGGGRFWAGRDTLEYFIRNGLIVKQYCDEDGNVTDNFPVNPNGSMLNIEAITNMRGNVKLGMTHDERKINALYNDRANLSLVSMREYIEDDCPDLGSHAEEQDIQITLKDYSYLCPQLDTGRTYDILIKMLTDDNERTTAQLFLGGGDIDRRRMIRLEMSPDFNTMEYAMQAMLEIAKMDFLDGIMLKKDLPYVVKDNKVLCYDVTSREGGRVTREFRQKEAAVPGFPMTHESVLSPNQQAYLLRKKLWENRFLRDAVTNVQTGAIFFFPDERSKETAVRKLFD